ncbi:MAG: hypothetical protein ACTHKZ_01850, partial [Lysobacteraceae bacterium]
MKLVSKISLFFGCLAVSATWAAVDSGHSKSLDLGVVPIGGVPGDMSIFKSNDCGSPPKLLDCSARDAQGRRYVFFEGALSKVSANSRDTALALRLPGGVAFGEDVQAAASKVEAAFGISLKRGIADGRIIYSSDYVAKSSAGVVYAVE